MKNLKLLFSKCFSSDSLLNAAKFCINSDNNDVYFSGNDFCIYRLDHIAKKVRTISLQILAEEFHLKGNDCSIVAMDYILEKQELCLVCSSGDIVTGSALTENFEIIGSLESNVLNAAWSPDQELLTLLTSADTFVMMTRDYDPLVENDLHPSEFGESKPINVGWGSKETQFHGSEGKAAAKKKELEVKPALSWDDHMPRISWRGDGEMFVTSVVDRNLGCRLLRVWSREGHLQFTSEIKEGLEHSLSWRLSGDLITCTQQLPNKHQVIFFEKNGLQYNEFTLPYKPNDFLVKEMTWNSDSSVLAIWGHKTLKENEFHVSLWSTKNYHWYLKQHLDFSSYGNLTIKCLLWDSHHAYKLHILCDNGLFFQYTFTWTHDYSLGNSEINNASVTVIDNDKALVTPFRRMIVPPPMCAYTITVPHSINSIAYAPGNFLENFILVLSDGSIVPCFKSSEQNGFSPSLNAADDKRFISKIHSHSVAPVFRILEETLDKIMFKQNPLFFTHWTWVADNKLLCFSSYGMVSNFADESEEILPALFSVDISNKTSEENLQLELKFCCEVNDSVIGMCANEDGAVIAIQLHSGKVLKYQDGVVCSWLCRNNKELQFPSPCNQFSVATINGEVVVFGLTERSCLYCNDSLLLSNCTSFFIHDVYLLASVSDNQLKLKCYEKEVILKNYYENRPTAEICSQQLERGAKIVVAVPMDTKVILQMPRGNLEVIHPRPLVLFSICKYLDGLQFDKAFTIAKRHRINLNILYDHNPKIFLENTSTFIHQLKSPTDLNLFITSMQEDDVSQSMYAFMYTKERSEACVKGNKIDLICNALRSILKLMDTQTYIQTVMATYALKSKPQLDEALLIIKEYKGSPEIVDEALRFLLYLVDISTLYNVALGTYDFEIAIMVAEKSNMDPKEYLPFLQELQELEENYRKYKIDMHLQRYKQALVNISKCDDDYFKECITLMKTQRLYQHALYLFPPESYHFRIVWTIYGDYLMEKMYFRQAGTVYAAIGNNEKALQAYQESGDWQLALCYGSIIDNSADYMSVLYEKIARKLKDNQRYEEAAFLFEYYIKDHEESIVTLIEGHLWELALYLMGKHERFDIAKTHLGLALQEHYEHLSSVLDTSLSSFNEYLVRLIIVRKNKELAALENGGHIDCPDDDDLFSETSSMSGISSSSSKAASKQLSGSLITRKSSRSRRKQELKKYRLKEGSPNEELALMAELSEIITKVDKLKDDFFSFLSVVMSVESISEAKELQQKMRHVHEEITAQIPNIWNLQKNCSTVLNTQFGPMSTTNSIVNVIQQQQKNAYLASDSEAPPPPVWRTNVEMFLFCLDS